MWIKVAIVAIGLAVLVAAALAVGSWRWRARTEALVAQLDAAMVPADVASVEPEALAGLPAPVRRYLDLVLPLERPAIERVRIAHTGTFDMGGAAPNWRPFTSVQEVRTSRPGFVWDARIGMAPGLRAHVHDAYVAGEGVLHATLAGLVTVMHQPSTRELAQGEALRYLAETPWYPSALLPGHGITWEPLDDDRAVAVLDDGDVVVRLAFAFGDDGLVAGVHADARYREVDGEQVATPWAGRFWDYQRCDGVLVPIEGEVAWVLADGARPYWRGTIERIAFDGAP